ncbi:MAG: hypothetical protein ACRD4Y_18305, partial [Candidatus Acidiferrales bacterium]
MRFAGNPLLRRFFCLIVHDGKRCLLWPDRNRGPAPLGWKLAVLCLMAAGVLVLPARAQRGAPTGGGGTHGSTGRPMGGVYYPPVYSNPTAEPTMQPMPDIPPLPKPAVPDDEKCFPWKISEANATV